MCAKNPNLHIAFLFLNVRQKKNALVAHVWLIAEHFVRFCQSFLRRNTLIWTNLGLKHKSFFQPANDTD